MRLRCRNPCKYTAAFSFDGKRRNLRCAVGYLEHLEPSVALRREEVALPKPLLSALLFSSACSEMERLDAKGMRYPNFGETSSFLGMEGESTPERPKPAPSRFRMGWRGRVRWLSAFSTPGHHFPSLRIVSIHPSVNVGA